MRKCGMEWEIAQRHVGCERQEATEKYVEKSIQKNYVNLIRTVTKFEPTTRYEGEGG